MASSAGLSSLGTLVDKFQLEVYKKALQAKGKGLPENADIKDILSYDTEVPPACLLKSLNADLAQRVRPLLTVDCRQQHAPILSVEGCQPPESSRFLTGSSQAQGFSTRFLDYQAGKLNSESEKEFLCKALRDCITKPDLRVSLMATTESNLQT